MAINAINSLFSTTPDANTNTTARQPQPEANTQATANTQAAANTPTDIVQLTEAQRVYQLYNQGQPVSQIANVLSLSEAQVNSYLKLSNSAA
jgi:DNA-binding CsgD family transcriptional regulator